MPNRKCPMIWIWCHFHLHPRLPTNDATILNQTVARCCSVWVLQANDSPKFRRKRDNYNENGTNWSANACRSAVLTLLSDRPMRGTLLDVFKKKFSKSLSDCVGGGDRRPSRGTFLVTFKKNPGVSVLIVLPLLHIQYSKTVNNNINSAVYFETILNDMMVFITRTQSEKFTGIFLYWFLLEWKWEFCSCFNLVFG